MHVETHGVSIGIESQGSSFYLNLVVQGKLTHKDYQIIAPMIDSAVSGVEYAEIDALIDARNFQGFEARAAWDDFKIGIKHGKKFKKIALLGNKEWQEAAVKVADWFMPSEFQFFQDVEMAKCWIQESDDC